MIRAMITVGVVYPFGNGNVHCCRSPPLTLSPSDNLLDLLKREYWLGFADLANLARCSTIGNKEVPDMKKTITLLLLLSFVLTGCQNVVGEAPTINTQQQSESVENSSIATDDPTENETTLSSMQETKPQEAGSQSPTQAGMATEPTEPATEQPSKPAHREESEPETGPTEQTPIVTPETQPSTEGETEQTTEPKEENAEFVMKWPMVEKRIRELIAVDRYLSPKEKEAYPQYLRDREVRRQRSELVDEFRSIIYDHNDFWEQMGDKARCFDLYPLAQCWSAFAQGKKTTGLAQGEVFILPTMREAMEIVIAANAHHVDRAKVMLEKLNGEIARPMEPTYDELNPPPPVPKEYKLSLGDALYIGAQQYELLSLGDEEVTLFDPSFPLFHQTYPRQEFFDLLKENPMNDKYLREVEAVPEAEVPAGDVSFDVEVERQLAEEAAAKEAADQQPAAESPQPAFVEYNDVKNA